MQAILKLLYSKQRLSLIYLLYLLNSCGGGGGGASNISITPQPTASTPPSSRLQITLTPLRIPIGSKATAVVTMLDPIQESQIVVTLSSNTESNISISPKICTLSNTHNNCSLIVTGINESLAANYLIATAPGYAQATSNYFSIIDMSSLFSHGVTTPTTLYPINTSGMNNSTVTILTTLQGLVAKSSATQLYLYESIDSYYQAPPEDQQLNLNSAAMFIKNLLTIRRFPALQIDNSASNSLATILNTFKSHITGYALYSESAADSRNLAVSYCGINNCIPITADYVQLAQSLGLSLKMQFSANDSYLSFLDTYGHLLNTNFALELSPDNSGWPMDYATMLGAFTYYTQTDDTLRTNIMNYLNKANPLPAPIFGWNAATGDEGAYVTTVSNSGNFVVASDNSSNLSLLSSSATIPLATNPAQAITYNPNKTYVTFIMSDGDNLQLTTNRIHDKRWWGNYRRGSFPLGWTISPAMFYLEPDIWNYYISSATNNDEFVVGPSGIGYVFEAVATSNKFAQQQAYLSKFMRATGIKTVALFENNLSPGSDLFITYFSAYAQNPQITAVYYAQFSSWMQQATDSSNIYTTQWINNKPIIPQIEVLQESPNINSITYDINTHLTQKNHGIYVVYAIFNDGKDTMNWLYSIKNQLSSNVQIVLPSQLADLAIKAKNR
jgi:hypothetical protein